MTPTVYDHPDYHALIRGIRLLDRAGDTDRAALARLVAADWLEERGEDERAEMIRRGCEMTCCVCSCESPARPRLHSRPRCDGCQERAALKLRCADLLAGPKPRLYENEVVWFHDGSGTDALRMVMRPDWERGFVARVRCELSRWLAHGPDLCRRHPVREVVTTDAVPGQRYWSQYGRHLSHWILTARVENCPACITHKGLWSILRESPAVLDEADFRLSFDTYDIAISALNTTALRWAEAEADHPAEGTR